VLFFICHAFIAGAFFAGSYYSNGTALPQQRNNGNC
jgi:hypothetical protein